MKFPKYVSDDEKKARALLSTKLGSYFNAIAKGRTHFAEVYFHKTLVNWDGHKDKATISKMVEIIVKIAEWPDYEELVVCVNEKNPDDLIDEIGISRAEILTALKAF